MFASAAIVTALAFASQISALEQGRAAFWHRDFQGAIDRLNTAAKADPKNAEVHLLLARALIELGRIPEALPHL